MTNIYTQWYYLYMFHVTNAFWGEKKVGIIIKTTTTIKIIFIDITLWLLQIDIGRAS